MYYRPQFTERQADTWQALELQTSQGNLTPVLGSGLTDRILGSREEVARSWAERWQMQIAPQDKGDLAKVAQYLQVRSAPGMVRAELRKHLMTEIQKYTMGVGPEDAVWNLPEELVQGPDPDPAILEMGRRLRERDPGDPYRVLAALPVRVYVTTGWTDLLQAALKEGGRQPVTMTFPWNDDTQPQRLRVTPTVEQPLVYHLYGRLDNLASLVLSEDDYFDWLNAWISLRNRVPPVVKKALTAQSLLFLGYSLEDSDFRFLLQGIKSLGKSMLQYNRHVAVLLRPEREREPELTEAQFAQDQISIYWGATGRFLDELRRRIAFRS
jgi:hypothetical protein